MQLNQTALQRTGTFWMLKGRGLMTSQSATCVVVCVTLPQCKEMTRRQMHACIEAMAGFKTMCIFELRTSCKACLPGTIAAPTVCMAKQIMP